MFKDLSLLTSVEMISSNHTKILSMISTFENCNNLEYFSISVFSGNEIKSMKKLFYNSKLQKFNFNNFTTNNLEDVSYMFSSTSFNILEFPKINTENIIDMSYLFTNCSSINELDISNLNSAKTQNMSHIFEGLLQIS